MRVVGIIAEYNPFHNGHAYQIRRAKELAGADYCVAAMSGDFVQRGAPAVFDKYTRARMALLSGADLVLEIPPLFATGSAEDFAACGVAILDRLGVTDVLCFGSECGRTEPLMEIAEILCEEPEGYRQQLTEGLKQGLTFPQAREAALEEYLRGTAEGSRGQGEALPASDRNLQTDLQVLLSSPNNILGIEYCKALLRRGSRMEPLTILRRGSGYHDKAVPTVESAASSCKAGADSCDYTAYPTANTVVNPPYAQTGADPHNNDVLLSLASPDGADPHSDDVLPTSALPDGAGPLSDDVLPPSALPDGAGPHSNDVLPPSAFPDGADMHSDDVLPPSALPDGAGPHSDDVLPFSAPPDETGPHSESVFSSAAALRELLRSPDSNRIRQHFTALSRSVPAPVLSLIRDAYPLWPEDFSALLSQQLLNLQLSGRPLTDFYDIPGDLAARISKRTLEFAGFSDRCETLKTKQYTYTRVSRALLHILLGMTAEDAAARKAHDFISYIRVLGFRKDAEPLLSAIARLQSRQNPSGATRPQPRQDFPATVRTQSPGEHSAAARTQSPREHYAAARTPLIMRTADAASILDTAALNEFRNDLYCSHLYQSVLAAKSGRRITNEYTTAVIVV